MLRTTLIFILIGSSLVLHAQQGGEKSALNKLVKGKWDRCKQKILKIKLKDSISIGGDYIYSRYFFAPHNPAYHIDSANYYLQRAEKQYSLASAKQKKRLRRLPLDSACLTTLREAIDSVAFARACTLQTEMGYTYFLNNFSQAKQQKIAITLRNEAGYNLALRENTYEAFADFIRKYPDAKEVNEAKARYEALLYESRTKDGKLESFQKYLHENPTSPFRRNAEKEIFEISTQSGEISALKKFISTYPNSHCVGKARNILYGLISDEKIAFEDSLLVYNDSLRTVYLFEHLDLIPFYVDGVFGFMDNHGTTLFTLTYPMKEAYLCGQIPDRIILDGNTLVSRTGENLFKHIQVKEIEDLGMGYYIIHTEGGKRVIHMGGFFVGPSAITDAFLLHKKYVAIKTGKFWSAYTLAGRRIDSLGWEDIKEYGSTVGFLKEGKWYLVQSGRVASGALQNLGDNCAFAEIKTWPGDLLWVRKGEVEGVLNNQLQEVVPLAIQNLDFTFAGILSTTSKGKRMHQSLLEVTDWYEDIWILKPWVGVKRDSGWTYLNPESYRLYNQSYDSIYSEGVFAMGDKQDTTFVHFSWNTVKPFVQEVHFKFLPAKDNHSFLMVDIGNKKEVYDDLGNMLFSLSCDDLRYVGDGIFVYQANKLYGLIRNDGKILTRALYDAIGELEVDRFPLLKDKSFGFYHIGSRHEVKPVFEKNVKSYSTNWLIAVKDGKWGFINEKGKAQSPYAYEEIQYWNKTTCWAKLEGQWVLMDIESQQEVIAGVERVEFVRDDAIEKVVIYRRDGEYGVYSSTSGEVIPCAFSDVVNVGSDTYPFYFTEKHVREASLFVVVYFDENGSFIRKQAYEGQEYDKIYCSK